MDAGVIVMFTDQVSHRLSDGVEARANALYLSPHKAIIVEKWFQNRFILTGPVCLETGVHAYRWPWKEAANYLRHKPGNPGCGIGNSDLPQHYQVIECYPATWRLENDDKVLNRIVAVLADNAQAFGILYWCVHELGGSDG